MNLKSKLYALKRKGFVKSSTFVVIDNYVSYTPKDISYPILR